MCTWGRTVRQRLLLYKLKLLSTLLRTASSDSSLSAVPRLTHPEFSLSSVSGAIQQNHRGRLQICMLTAIVLRQQGKGNIYGCSQTKSFLASPFAFCCNTSTRSGFKDSKPFATVEAFEGVD